MATFSSHLLDATNGSHAANVDVIIYQVYESGEKKVFFETKSDEGGRILQEFESVSYTHLTLPTNREV